MSKLTAIIPIYVDIMPGHEDIEFGRLYITKDLNLAIHLCACGCGKEVVTKLRPFWGDGWEIINNEGLVTLRPSIGNWNKQSPYHAHYYITDNKIDWL
jgi:hypothetical protein